jgi:tetratricopeptide (TPR) repeat protein/ketosteroid isomerase-like protein
MLGSARRSLESLGHIHALLEIDMFAGMVELLAGEAVAAETVLRRAHRGFVARGVGVDAAQAAALLARALLAQGLVEEALTFTEGSERLAGVDLKSAIAWRAARAEALAHQGHTVEALEAARAAVALADPTDALIDQADAHLSLAVVLRASGNDSDAEREARRALDLYERKGATARVAAVQGMLGSAPLARPKPSLAQTARRRVRPNAAIAAEERCSQLLETLNVDAFAALIAADFVQVDHATRVTTDRDAYIHQGRMVAAADRVEIDIEPLVSLGERHALTRVTYRLEGAAIVELANRTGHAEIVQLNVTQTDASGRISRIERFDPEHLNSALPRLVELHADHELPPAQHDARYLVAQQLRGNLRRWSDDAVVVDHRPASLGTLHGRDAIRAAGRALRDLTGGAPSRVADVLGSTEWVVLVDLEIVGRTDSGETFELPMLTVGEYADDGFLRRAEWYLPEQVDEALARFDELTGSARPDALKNEASSKLDELYDALLRGEFNTFAAATSANAVIDDRRPIMRLRTEGRDAVVSYARSVMQAGVTAIQATTIATRGRRLALRHESHRGRQGETEVVFLCEFAADGPYLGGCVFDADDLDAAFDELDTRYLAGDGMPHAQTLRPWFEFLAAYNRQDWAQCRGLLADAFAVADHRPTPNLYGAINGPDDFIRTLKTGFELSTERCARTLTIPAVDDGAAVFQLRTTASTRDGADTELAFHVAYTALGGRMTRLEFFADNQLNAAVGRFHELTPSDVPACSEEPVSTAVPQNSAANAWRRAADAGARQDTAGFVACCADDVVYEDRRSLVGRLVISGHRGIEDMVRGMAGVSRVDSQLLATRGDRLVLHRAWFRGEPGASGPFEVETLELTETDRSGLIARWFTFDPDHLDDAFDELDARYAAGEAAPWRAEWAIVTSFILAANRRDWDRLKLSATDDCTYVDHRSTGLGTLDCDQYVASLRALVELAPDVRVQISAVHGLSRDGIVYNLHYWGRNTAGGVFESGGSGFALFRAGQYSRIERFPFDDPQAAIDRFEQLTAPTNTTLVEENAVTRLVNEWADRLCDGDLQGYLALHADDFRFEDRRTGLQLQVAGSSIEEQARLIIAFLRGRRPEISVIATRAEALGLFLATFRGSMGVSGDAEISFFLVEELDARGRASQGVALDPNDLAVALTELDDLYSNQLPPHETEVFALARSLVDRYNRRAWDELKELFARDSVIVDERMTGWGTINVDEFVRRSEELIDMVPDAFLMNVMVERAGVTRSRVTGTVPAGGGPFELIFDTVATVSGSRIARLDLLPPAAKYP